MQILFPSTALAAASFETLLDDALNALDEGDAWVALV